jgi:hypothetical protein
MCIGRNTRKYRKVGRNTKKYEKWGEIQRHTGRERRQSIDHGVKQE